MSKKKKKSFGGQLKKAFVTTILIPMICLGGFILYSVFHYMEERTIAESDTIVKQNLTDLNNKRESCDTAIRYLGANYNLQDFLLMNQTDYLELSRASKNVGDLFYNVLNTNPYFKDLVVYTEKDLYRLTNFVKDARNVENESWYQSAMEAEGNFWLHENGRIFICRKIMAAYPMEAIGMIRIEVKRNLFEDSFQIFQDVPIRITMKEGEETFYQHKNSTYQKPVGYIKTETFGIPGWEIQYEIAESYYESYAMLNLVPSILLLLLVLLLTWILIRYFRKRLSRDLSLLLKEVEEAQGGNLDVEIRDVEILEIQRLSDSIKTFLNKIKMLIREVYNKEIERQNLELNLLQAKMNPHFLYNNLSAINWIALECGNKKISRITTELAAFYRTALNKGKNIDKLSVEIANIKAYINLQLISHEESFEVEYELEEGLLNYDVPIFILQPLVENAIEHGIDQLRDRKGKIRISVRKSEEELLLTVQDNGTQLYDKIGENVLDEKKYGYGTGNVHKRIQLLYGEKSGLRLWADETGTTAEIRIFYKALRHAEVM